MPEPRPSAERTELLADVAEMYYLEDKTQAQIAKRIGVTRSMVSRMLSDVRRLGIVKIQISRPLQFDRELEAALIARFHLRGACVPVRRNEDDSARLLRRLGSAGRRRRGAAGYGPAPHSGRGDYERGQEPGRFCSDHG